MDLHNLTPQQARQIIRQDQFVRTTSGLCPGYAQCNLIVLPRDLADDFRLFAQRNPMACPVLEISESRFLQHIAPGADIATDFPLYRVYRDGVMTEEITNVSHLWRDDLVSFLIGCSFSFEDALLQAGIPMRHNDENCTVPMYITNIACTPAGVFSGNMVVSMRPIRPEQVELARSITAAMPRVHGAPVHVGDGSAIGIKDINKPDFGHSVTIHPGEVPVFWPCGVTPQSVVMNVRPPFAITHAPGHMLICDVRNSDLMET